MTDVAQRPCTAFEGDRQIAAGPLGQVALAVKARQDAQAGPLLVFDDVTGRVLDLDLRGDEAAIRSRLPALASLFGAPGETDDPPTPAGPRGRGRPKLGVVAREVTLLPRHWAWLAAQPGGASVALRKLVDQARRESAGDDLRRQSAEAAYRVMAALAGDRPGFEEASRALFARDAGRLDEATRDWPRDLARYVASLAFRGEG